jgi:hypothetical protein
MHPLITVLGKDGLSEADMARFAKAVEGSGGNIRLIVDPAAGERMMGMMTPDLAPTLFAALDFGILQKSYKPKELMRAFLTYNERLHRSLADEMPKIIAVDHDKLDETAERIEHGWMGGLAAFHYRMVPEARKLLVDRPELRGPILVMPTKKGKNDPKFGWGPLEKTLAAIPSQKTLKFSGASVFIDPVDGRLMHVGREYKERLMGKADELGIGTFDETRDVAFPDLEGLKTQKHTFHEGRVEDTSPKLQFHPPKNVGIAFVDYAMDSGFRRRKGQSDPNRRCPCGREKMFKDCHGKLVRR